MTENGFSKTIRVGEREIGPGQPTFVVAEVGSNHNGDFLMAKRLIDVAANAKADAAKFQLFRAEYLYPPNCGPVNTPTGPVDFFELFNHSTLPPEWLPDLKTYTEDRNLIFLCTPFDEMGVNHLASLSVSAIKIASPELNHIPLLRAAANHRKPLFCSTGLSDLRDIEEALQTIRAEWTDAAVALLHCSSAYPLPPEEVNLGVIQTLHRAFGVPIGFSDHTADPEMIPAIAVGSGACILEKHFTLSRSLSGPDHAFALEEDGLARMIRLVRQVERIDPLERMAHLTKRFGRHKIEVVLGHGRKEITASEGECYPNDKRSIRVIREVKPGEILSYKNIRILRSERNLSPGIHPRYWEIVLGARAVRDIAAGEGLCWDHLLAR